MSPTLQQQEEADGCRWPRQTWTGTLLSSHLHSPSGPGSPSSTTTNHTRLLQPLNLGVKGGPQEATFSKSPCPTLGWGGALGLILSEPLDDSNDTSWLCHLTRGVIFFSKLILKYFFFPASLPQKDSRL
jgi:hypothetical protein